MTTMANKGLLVVVAGAIALVLLLIRGPFSGVREIAHKSIRLHLSLFGSSIYECYSATGKWPTHVGDLTSTSLPAKSPYWKYLLDAEVDVIVWHKTLNPNPKDNAASGTRMI